MKKRLLFLFLFFPISIFAQKNFDFRFWEDSLGRLREQVMRCPNETERFSLNEDFMNLLEFVLFEPKSFDYDWANTANFSVVKSPDNLFKIFTWYVAKDNRTVENFGFLHHYNDGRKKFVIYPLYDKRVAIDYPETSVADHNRWYGAVYYSVIPLQTKGKTYYTLLGLNTNDIFTNQKIIEILHFKKDNTPVFGAKIFKNYPKGKVARVIFEYNKESSLSLKYGVHAYNVGTGKRDPKTKRIIYTTVRSEMIIFDELIPMSDGMPDIPAYLVPESSLNQAFIPQDGAWVFVPSVLGRNPDKPREQYKHKNRDFYIPPKNETADE
ncbi:hypothetical protein LJC53_06050 [Bacteroidales bacterium OttesenSCG-928-C03]|nr:hypothetical protein [Bacteroidales bacterium OttesenSCG-928-E04]MDL2309127.1 hypothetical protein [Bacteroidales bacterium OttesenSCG-928-C03]MDL2325969.1 hypothetical protein [Bacteroidales bacterium OttesenSCG-928-A14]